MVIVQVYIRVKESTIDDFVSATIDNAKNSIKESGIIRFDFLHCDDDPQSFLLTEIYEDDQAALDHKKTTHYNHWRENVADMMDAPRNGVRYHPIFPVGLGSWRSANDE